MAYDKFLIGYQDNRSGLQTNLKPWLIADNAFEALEDAYIFRGRVKKRFGSILMGADQTASRLRINLGNTNGSGAFSGTVPGVVFEIGQMFSCGTDIYTVYQTGTPGSCLSTSTATCTYNTSNGAVVIAGAAASTAVYFYPATPVMGLAEYYIDSTAETQNIAFDTQFAYQFNRTSLGWYQLSSGASTWTGSDSQFFWSANYQGATVALNSLWVTNFNPADGIRCWNNSTWIQPVINWTYGSSIGTTNGSGAASGTVPGSSGFIGQVFNIGTTSFAVTVANGALTPTSNALAGSVGTGTFDTATGAYTFTGATANAPIYFTGNNYVQTAQLIVQFKNRLVLLNTVEMVNGTSTNFPFRARYCAISSPLAVNAWMQDVPGNGSAIDAPTQEAIVTAQFVKDRLIVYFTSSTYELVYTGNEIFPFVFQKINNELGAVSTFSEIPFDKVTIGIDDIGIHACNGSNVYRIDTKIPQYTFDLSSENAGFERVSGIRDYFNEMAYWTIVPTNRNSSFYFPNLVLVYNYANYSWSKIHDSFTTFGYFVLTPYSNGITWGATATPWGQITDFWNFNGNTSNNTTVRTVLGGNQQGYILVLRPDTFSNAPSLQVSSFSSSAAGIGTISCINHNLSLNQFVLLSDMHGLTFTDSLGNTLPNLMCRVTPDPVSANTPNQFSFSALDNSSLPITITGTYTGGGTVSLVSNMNILSKQYNFYTEQDRNMYMQRVDFLVDRTTNGVVTADYLVSSTPLSMISEGIGNVASPGPLPGNGTLETSPYALAPFEQYQTRLWHPVYLYAEGECVQLQLYMSPNQMFSYNIVNNTVQYVALNDFELHAMVFYVTPTSVRMT